MRSTQQAIRRCIDSFADDLIELADQLIHEQVAKALSRIKPAPAPRERAVKPKPEKQPRRPKLTPVERLERARARQAERAEARRGEKQLALPFNGQGETSQGGGAAAQRGGRRKSAVPEAAVQKAPPPLFVVKRTREGNVPLQRKAEAEAAAAHAAPSENALPS